MARAGVGLISAIWFAVLATAQTPTSGYTRQLPPGFPPPPIPADNLMSEAKVELGRHLFYDARLSGNGRQSCATCHMQSIAFTDGRARSIGSTGREHPRGSMSLVNVAYSSVLNWATVTSRLEDQEELIRDTRFSSPWPVRR